MEYGNNGLLGKHRVRMVLPAPDGPIIRIRQHYPFSNISRCFIFLNLGTVSQGI
jgi:hypothetical protein